MRCDDASQVDELLDQAVGKVDGFYGDGDYDQRKTYETLKNATSERSFCRVAMGRFGNMAILATVRCCGTRRSVKSAGTVAVGGKKASAKSPTFDIHSPYWPSRTDDSHP